MNPALAPQAQQNFGSVLAMGGQTNPSIGNIPNTANALSSAQNVLNQAKNTQVPGDPNAHANPKGSWLDRLLPTVGGIVGGIGGSLLGGAADVASLGTLAPLINPITLGVAGAGLGGGLGQMGENALTGKKVLQGNDLVSAGENAGGQLLGEGIGSLAGKVIGKAGSMLSNGAVDAVMGQAPGAIDRPTSQYLIDNGITDLNKIKDIAPLITGQTGGEGAAFTNGVEGAVNNATDKVSIKNAMSSVQDPLSSSIMSETTNKNAAKAIQRSIDNMVTNSGGQITKNGVKPLSDLSGIYEHGQMDNISRGAAYNEAQQFLKAANQILGKAPKDAITGNILDPQQSALYNTFNLWGHQLESSALGLGPSDTPLALSAEDRALLKEGIAPLQKSSPKLYQTLSDQIDGAQTWKDIKSAQAPLVQASKAADYMSGKLNAMPRTTPVEAASNGKSGIIKTILGSPILKRGEALGYSKLGDIANSNIVSNVAPLLARTGTLGATDVMGGQLAPVNTPSTPLNGAQGNQPNNQTQGIGGSTLMNNPVMQALQEAMSNPAMNGEVSQLVPEAQKVIALSNLINQSGQLYQNAGGAQGGVGGLLTRLSALAPGSAAGQYQRSQGATSAAIANLLGIPPTSAAALLPTFTENPNTANINLSSLYGLLNPTQGYAY